MKLEFLLQIFEKYINIKFHESPSNWSWVVLCGWTDGQTDVTKLIVTVWNFANALIKERRICSFHGLDKFGGRTKYCNRSDRDRTWHTLNNGDARDWNMIRFTEAGGGTDNMLYEDYTLKFGEVSRQTWSWLAGYKGQLRLIGRFVGWRIGVSL
jgi:hypothetical protein